AGAATSSAGPLTPPPAAGAPTTAEPLPPTGTPDVLTPVPAAPAPGTPGSPGTSAGATPEIALPGGPPPRAAAAGSPPSAAPAQAPATAAPAGGGARVGFAPGSAALSPEAAASVKQFASSRGSSTIVVTGYGDATGSDVAAQTAALSLGLSRAQAIANALTAAGVPQSAVRVGAEAAGRGARLLLLQ
ncbi:MAG: OmpA family protein, partial [Rhodospirillales bacterium]|nr:OmpA family protein [Rhodospirillales bacterium]